MRSVTGRKETVIKAESLSYTYTPGGAFEKAAVCDVCFHIEKGTFCGVIGHTGSGKTTLMQLLAGLLEPTSGAVYIDGVNISDKKTHSSAYRRKVGVVFQYPEYQLFGETVLEDILFGPRNMGFSEAEAKERAIMAAEAVGLKTSILQQSPFSLSGGQKRRAAIAGVLAMEPEILIFDEPTAGLDPVGRDDIIERIVSLQKKEHKTILWVTHSMEDIARISDRIFVMQQGKLVMDKGTDEIFENSDFLYEMGLDVPEITHVMAALGEYGLKFDKGIYTVEAAKNAILKRWEAEKC